MAENKNTGFKRATSAVVSNFESGSILSVGEGIASSSTEDGVLILSDFNFNVPSGATIEGIRVQSKVLNEGSGSVPEYGDLTVRAQVGYGDSYGTSNDTTLSDNTLISLDFGGSTSLQEKTWTSTQANNLQLKFTYVSDNSGFSDTQLLTISGSSTNFLPAVNIYYSHTPDITYTRAQLRNRITSSQIFDSDDMVEFTLTNNASTVAYFNIEGVNGKDIFNSASIYNLSNCTLVSESFHAGVVVDPNVTATFRFLPTHDIQKDEIQFIAANRQHISGSTTTHYGIELGISSVI